MKNPKHPIRDLMIFTYGSIAEYSRKHKVSYPIALRDFKNPDRIRWAAIVKMCKRSKIDIESIVIKGVGDE
jgi:hypothetical protein